MMIDVSEFLEIQVDVAEDGVSVWVEVKEIGKRILMLIVEMKDARDALYHSSFYFI
jgi:hypothetical protein